MAGFDFDFTFSEDQRPYVEACIRASKTRARQLRCSWRVERSPGPTIYCRISGHTRRLDLLGHVLERDLPIVCEGVEGGLQPRQASALGRGFAEVFLVGRDVDRGADTQELKPVAQTSLYYPVFDLTSGEIRSPSLNNRLRITEDVVSDYGMRRIEAVVVLEELHTAIEQVLRYLLAYLGRKDNWPKLIEEAEKVGYLSKDPAQYSSQLGPEHHHTDRELLIDGGLNTRRNKAKHEGADLDDPWLSEHWECVSSLLEGLAERKVSHATPGAAPST